MKVLGFDSWTGGAHHYQRLIEAFRARGLELSLLHLGSWGSDPGRPPVERLGELPARDIASYRGRGLREVLDEERPDAVLFLSTDTFAHRAFNRYCRQRGVPTLNLYHGLVRVQAVDEGSPYKLNLLAHLRFVAVRIVKALTLVWPTYAASLWRTGASWAEWQRFGRDVLMGGLGRFSFDSADDARTDLCCVYVGADVEHAIRKYRFRPEDVIAVGNPDLARFGLHSNLIASRLDGPLPEATDVMYVDTGLIYTGFVFDSPEEFVRHLVATKDALARKGLKLLFKPHPDHTNKPILAELTSLGIEVCSNADFVARLVRCRACIVEPSTVAVIPALVGLPLLLAQYGKLAGQPYGTVLREYPRAVPLTSLPQLDAVLDARPRGDEAAVNEWIARNAGPLPAEEMPARVAAIMGDLASRRGGAPR